MYGHQPRLCIDTQLLTAAQNSGVTEFAASMLPSMEIVHKAMLENIAHNRERQKFYHDAHARQHSLQVGDLVYQFDVGNVLSGTACKTRPRYFGPLRILEIIGQCTARVQDIHTGKINPVLVNISYLKTARDRRNIIAKYFHGMQTQQNDQGIQQTDNITKNTPNESQTLSPDSAGSAVTTVENTPPTTSAFATAADVTMQKSPVVDSNNSTDIVDDSHDNPAM